MDQCLIDIWFDPNAVAKWRNISATNDFFNSRSVEVESSPIGGENWSAEILEIVSYGILKLCLENVLTRTRPWGISVRASSHKSPGIQRINGIMEKMVYHKASRALSLVAWQHRERDSSVLLSQ
jgi:hypothetical protein